jgi:hypothetical protein
MGPIALFDKSFLQMLNVDEDCRDAQLASEMGQSRGTERVMIATA